MLIDNDQHSSSFNPSHRQKERKCEIHRVHKVTGTVHLQKCAHLKPKEKFFKNKNKTEEEKNSIRKALNHVLPLKFPFRQQFKNRLKNILSFSFFFVLFISKTKSRQTIKNKNKYVNISSDMKCKSM